METTLRPLTLGEILDRTAQLYRTNFAVFAGIASVYAGAVLAVGLGQIGVQELLKATHFNRQLSLVNAVLLVFQFLLIFVLSGLAVAANNRAVAWVHLGKPATVGGAYAGVLPKTGRYMWLMTIVSFLVGWPLVLFYLGYILAIIHWIKPLPKAAMAAGKVSAATQANVMILGVLTLLFLVLLAIGFAYAVFMGIRYSLAVPACVVEDLKARSAIRRSIELSKGARGKIFVLGLLVFMISVGLALLGQTFFFVQIFKHHGVLPAGMRILQQLVAFATNTFTGPIYATGMTLFYFDQRVRNEGYDIEWMMQAAGLTSPPPETARADSRLEVSAPPLEIAASPLAVAEGPAGAEPGPPGSERA